MKKSTAIFWGIVLVAVGVLLILVQLDFIQISIFSAGDTCGRVHDTFGNNVPRAVFHGQGEVAGASGAGRHTLGVRLPVYVHGHSRMELGGLSVAGFPSGSRFRADGA